ncbi:MAG: PKD domain-containing protein [Hyphomicrobiales bacterium]
MKRLLYYTILLSISSLLLLTNCKKEAEDTVDCAFVGLKVDFSYEYNEEPAPVIVNFKNESENADKFEWNFGTDDRSTLTEPSYEYEKAGNYKVTLKGIHTLPNGDQCFLSKTKEIIIQ